MTSKFAEALAYAADLHADQRRKGGDIPYVGHLLSVAGLVIEAGGSEEQAIAALLHDAAEDQGGDATLAAIEARFGPGVAEIVAGCSDTFETPKPPWRERKERYVAHLREAPEETLLVSLADKLDNARAILRDFRTHGPALWERFNVSDPEQHLWYYRSLLEVFRSRLDGWPADELDRVLTELERLVAAPAPEGPDADDDELPLSVLAPRRRLVSDAIARSEAWLLAQEEEIAAEYSSMAPGDPDSDIDYDYSAAVKGVLDRTRATIDALRAEQAEIAGRQQQWATRHPRR